MHKATIFSHTHKKNSASVPIDWLEHLVQVHGEGIELNKANLEQVKRGEYSFGYLSILTVCSLPLVRVTLLARHSTPTLNASMAGPSSIITQSGWLAFFNSELCSVYYRDEFGLEFN